VYAAEFVWPSKAKSCSCRSLKLTKKNRQDEVKFTFDVSSAIEFLMNLLRMGTLDCHMPYLHLRS